jgi:hypothetical protein
VTFHRVFVPLNEAGGHGIGIPCATLEPFILGAGLGVVLNEFVALRANPIGIAGGAPSLLPAIVDERRKTSLLLFCGERHIGAFILA